MFKFTIIIPVYNVQFYIEKCLNSLRNQTYSNFEVILVDDGSTDNSGDICKNFCSCDTRFKYLHQVNQGQGPARNHGLDFAKGDYLLFVDSDDWVEENLLERCAEVLNETPVDFLNFRFNFITENKKLKKTAPHFNRFSDHNSSIFYAALLEDQVYSVVWNKVYKRSIISNHNIRFPDIRAIEDLYFTRAVSKFSNTVLYIDDILYHALVRPGSSSRSMGLHSFSDAEKLLQLEYESLILNSNDQDLSRYFYAHSVKFLTYLLVQASFRINSTKEYMECHSIVFNNNYYKKGGQLEIGKLLPPKNIFLIYISRHPVILRLASKILLFFGISPY